MEQVLPNRTPRSAVSAPIWAMIPLSVFLLGFGIALLFFPGEGQWTRPGVNHVALLLVNSLGVLLCVAGALLFQHEIGRLRRGWRRQSLALKNPSDPWLLDFDWNREGVGDDMLSRAGRALFAGFGLALLAAPFNWVVFVRLSELDAGFWRWIAIAIVLAFDFIALYSVAEGLRRILMRLKFGKAYLKFDRFPFFLGQELVARLQVSDALLKAPFLSCTLRLVEERKEESRGGKGGRRVRIRCYELFSQSQPFEIVASEVKMTEGLRIRLPLPADRPATALLQDPPRYWELAVEAEMPGVDFETTFLLPVYPEPR